MAGNRKWVTREEIAEIYDSMTKKAERGGIKTLHKADKFRKQAEDIRATERLSKPLGWRVA